MEVKFYDNADDDLLKFAVIISKSMGKWVLCKHKERNTYEIPGGHREKGEESFGMLYFANIYSFEKELKSEIERIELFDELPGEWTYPLIQPLLIAEYIQRMSQNN